MKLQTIIISVALISIVIFENTVADDYNDGGIITIPREETNPPTSATEFVPETTDTEPETTDTEPETTKTEAETTFITACELPYCEFGYDNCFSCTNCVCNPPPPSTDETTPEPTQTPCEIVPCMVKPGCTVDFDQDNCKCIYVCMTTTDPARTRRQKCFALP